MVQRVERAGRRRVEGGQQVAGGNPADGRPLGRDIAVDAVVVEAARHTLRQQLAAAEGASGNGDNGHGQWGLVNGMARRSRPKAGVSSRVPVSCSHCGTVFPLFQQSPRRNTGAARPSAPSAPGGGARQNSGGEETVKAQGWFGETPNQARETQRAPQPPVGRPRRFRGAHASRDSVRRRRCWDHWGGQSSAEAARLGGVVTELTFVTQLTFSYRAGLWVVANALVGHGVERADLSLAWFGFQRRLAAAAQRSLPPPGRTRNGACSGRLSEPVFVGLLNPVVAPCAGCARSHLPGEPRSVGGR